MGPGATVGPDNFPAKYSFNEGTANCSTAAQPDFVVYNTSLAGSLTQATIGAFDNIYSSCSGTVPTTYWAYNTGTTGAVQTSPVLSGDGKQVAFIQNTATTATLVLIKWLANDGAFLAPTTLTNSASAAAYSTCVTTTAGPCMFTITFSILNGGAASLDTISSPFYDFANDALYVGNANGYLHKFNPVFLGAPAEIVSTAGANRWPATVIAASALTSPVFDDGTGGVFVASAGRHLYRVDSIIGKGAGGTVASGLLGNTGIDDSPLLDPSTENVYVFVRGDATAGAGRRAGVYQFSASFAAGATGTEAQVGSNNTLPATGFYAGDFDNIYYTSANGTGNMYVCGTNGGLTALWQIPVTAGVLGTPVAGPTLTTVNVACSPITEFYDGTTDWMFLNATNDAVTVAPVTCPTATGCVMSYNITSAAGWGTTTTTSHTVAAASGASGIVVDGNSTTVGASQVYFTPLANQPCTTSGGSGGCAIQASQSGLN